MQNLKIIFGTKCNLNCDYCYQKHDNNEISQEVLDKIIEKINLNNESYNIHLFGGEPLLYLDKIFYLLDRIDIKKHNFGISTNGTLINEFRQLEEKLGYPIRNLISNKNNGNYEKLNENSQFRFILTKNNLEELERKLDWFLEYYGNDFSIYCNFYEEWTEDLLNRVEVIERKAHLNYPRVRILKPQTTKNTPCNCRSIIVNWNGDYLKCHRDPNKIIGNIFNDEFIVSNNTECVFKNDIQKNFVRTMSNTEEMTCCDYDAVFYC